MQLSAAKVAPTLHWGLIGVLLAVAGCGTISHTQSSENNRPETLASSVTDDDTISEHSATSEPSMDPAELEAVDTEASEDSREMALESTDAVQPPQGDEGVAEDSGGSLLEEEGQEDVPARISLAGKLGVAMVPANLPTFREPDVEDMLAKTREVGAGIAILPWNDLNLLSTARTYLEWGRENQVTIVLAINTTAIHERSRVVVPDHVATTTGEVAFENEEVRNLLIDDCVALANWQPPYLALGTESNLLKMGNPAEFEAFLTVYKEAYAAIKAVSPLTKVLTTFQWDEIYLSDTVWRNGGAHGVEIIDAFRPELDVLALTSYPAAIWRDPENVPADLYRRIAPYGRLGEELIMMEIGWPSQDPGSQEEQVLFLEDLPELFGGTSVSLLGWSLLHDVPLSFLSRDLATTGLIRVDGSMKPAWNSLLNLSNPRQ